MKPVYRIFSRRLFLNIVTGFLILMTLQLAIIGCTNIYRHGIDYLGNGNLIGVAFFLILLLLDIWLLTATFLPLIKINKHGITAYSVFWKRNLRWNEIKSAKLVKCFTRYSTGQLSISFNGTNIPETKNNALINKGVRVNTFIFVSSKDIKPPNLLLGSQLLSHNKMTTKDEISFEFEARAWQLIQEKLNQQHT